MKHKDRNYYHIIDKWVELKWVFKKKYGAKDLYGNRTLLTAKSAKNFYGLPAFITPKNYMTENKFPGNALNKRQQTAYSRAG